MKKIILFFAVYFLSSVGVYAVTPQQAYNQVQRAKNCYYSLPSDYRSSVSRSYYDARKYLRDASKYQNMNGYQHMARAYYDNAYTYANIVLQIGRSMGSRSCN